MFLEKHPQTYCATGIRIIGHQQNSKRFDSLPSRSLSFRLSRLCRDLPSRSILHFGRNDKERNARALRVGDQFSS